MLGYRGSRSCGQPSSVADGLSATTDNVLVLIGVRLPALMEAEQKGVGGHFGQKLDLLMETFRNAMCLFLFVFWGAGVGFSSFSIFTT